VSPAAVLDQLESAQLLRYLVEEERVYIFRHTLTQESTYDSLLKNRRREIHLSAFEFR
jgi:predicted ATPase